MGVDAGYYFAILLDTNASGASAFVTFSTSCSFASTLAVSWRPMCLVSSLRWML